MTDQLLKAIGPSDLTGYFEFLDELRDSGTPMYGAGLYATRYLERKYPSMATPEARAVLIAWQDTFSSTLPAEDRVDALLDA